MQIGAADITKSTMANYQKLQELLNGAECVLNGSSLDIASVVGVAKYA